MSSSPVPNEDAPSSRSERSNKTDQVSTILASLEDPSSSSSSFPLECTQSHTRTHSRTHSYRMPAEWEPHSACLLMFPHNPNTFRVDRAAEELLGLALAIAKAGREAVCLLCFDEESARTVAARVRDAVAATATATDVGADANADDDANADADANANAVVAPIWIAVCPSNDTWARDTAPTFVVRSRIVDDGNTSNSSSNDDDDELIGLDWGFNAYGGPEEGAYWPCTEDQAIARTVCSEDTMATDATAAITTTVTTTTTTTTTTDNPGASAGSSSLSLAGSEFDSGSEFEFDFDRSLARTLSIRGSLSVPMILEGGSIHTDGEGTLLTTAECLLHPNRNPNLTREEIERVLERSLGVSKILWLPYGLDHDDDTNGHVDNFCCFAGPGHVVLAWTDHDDDHDNNNNNNDDDDDDDAGTRVTNYQRCRAALAYLESQTDARGRSLAVTKLHLPHPGLAYTDAEAASIGSPSNDGNGNDNGNDNDNDTKGDSTALVRHPGEPMAASYVNYYVANGAVLVPQFGGGCCTVTDSLALETLRPLYPGREVVGIPSREILLGGGNIHCQTQQVPALHRTAPE